MSGLSWKCPAGAWSLLSQGRMVPTGSLGAGAGAGQEGGAAGEDEDASVLVIVFCTD